MPPEITNILGKAGGFGIVIFFLWKMLQKQIEQNKRQRKQNEQLRDLMDNHLDSAQEERKNMRQDYGEHIHSLKQTMQQGFDTLHKDLKGLKDHFNSENN